MKKRFWMLGMAVITLASCTQNEVLDVPEGKKIIFEEFVENNTRAFSDVTKNNLLAYWVQGYYTPYTTGTDGKPIFNFSSSKTILYEDAYSPSSESKTDEMYMSGEILSIDSETKINTIKWTYGVERHWIPGNLYRFAAYSNGNSYIPGVAYDPIEDKLTIPNYSVYDSSGNEEQSKDLVASIAGDRTAESGVTSVQFSFKHLLSKVTIRLINASDNADVHFNNLKIANVIKTGSCVCEYDPITKPYPKNVQWSGESNEVFQLNTSTEVVHESDEPTHVDLDFYFIPQSNENKVLSLNLLQEIAGEQLGNPEDLSFNLACNTTLPNNGATISNQWVPGYHYRYIISKGDNFSKISFEVNVNEWVQDRDGNKEITDADNVVPSVPTPIPGQGESQEGGQEDGQEEGQ